VLFHGCTIPRGESRTYPNIVSYEAVNGTEYY
ncbi:MAG: glycoside hydrolase family 97 catalytic domain-containing protein, partial [Oscillospiraceae bacterium]|nr:glycoside hydrolase family 97 catalytic domain-containing protein [Oscillospiraceae bacterium]